MKISYWKEKRIVRVLTILLIAVLLTGIGVHLITDDNIVYSQENIAGSDEVTIVPHEEGEQGATTTPTTEPTTTVTPSDTVSPSVTATPTVTPSVSPTPTAVPASSVNVSHDYVNETIVVTKGTGGSTRFYFSQDKMKTWQLIEDANGKISLEIFLKSSENKIYFKGDKDENPVELIIPKEEKSLKVTYYVENNVGKLKFENVVAGQSVEYRKGKDGNWKTYIQALDLSDYEINGFTLQFRIMASKTQRAGKVVSVKIPKRQNPPSVKVDYSKFQITGVKAGVTQYRLAGTQNWITFTPGDSKVKTLNLLELLLPKGTVQNFTAIPAGKIEFRTLGTEKKVASGIIVLDTIAQPAEPAASKVTLEGTNLTFKDASKENPYEYIVVHENDKIDLATAKWTKVTTTKTIAIKKVGTAAPIVKDVIYYREASTTDKKTKVVTPASMYGKISITAISN